jgi:hypothetical protein
MEGSREGRRRGETREIRCEKKRGREREHRRDRTMVGQ